MCEGCNIITPFHSEKSRLQYFLPTSKWPLFSRPDTGLYVQCYHTWLDYDGFQCCNIFCPPLSGLSCTWPSTLLLSFLNSLNPWTLHEIHTLHNTYSPVQTKFCTLVCIMQNGDYSLQDAQCILSAAHKANCRMRALQNGFTLEAAVQQRQTSA